jgi:hypothetical protein
LPAFIAQYRFFFNPIRYTSLGLAVCEAMMVGLPIIGLATTEMTTVVENGVSGYVDTAPLRLVRYMQELLAAPAEARRLGHGARRYAQARFNIVRFARDWEAAFTLVTGKKDAQSAVSYAQPSLQAGQSLALNGIAAQQTNGKVEHQYAARKQSPAKEMHYE